MRFHQSTMAADPGPFRVWEEPDISHRYVMGADSAEGLEWGDFSCAHVLDLATGNQVAMWHGHVEADLFGQELARIGEWYNFALVGVESNNHGLTTITAMRGCSYPMMFRRRTLNRTSNRQTMEFGFRTTTTSKPLLVDELAAALRNDEIHIRDAGTIAELRTFVRDEKAKMHGSPYDDRVMALGIANQMRKYAFQPEYVPKVDNYMTGEWWAQQIENPKSTALGAFNTRRR